MDPQAKAPTEFTMGRTWCCVQGQGVSKGRVCPSESPRFLPLHSCLSNFYFYLLSFPLCLYSAHTHALKIWFSSLSLLPVGSRLTLGFTCELCESGHYVSTSPGFRALYWTQILNLFLNETSSFSSHATILLMSTSLPPYHYFPATRM